MAAHRIPSCSIPLPNKSASGEQGEDRAKIRNLDCQKKQSHNPLWFELGKGACFAPLSQVQTVVPAGQLVLLGALPPAPPR
jgi:hypothetical protein